MTDAKVKNQELIKLRRNVALRELALASSYPQTHTGIVMQRKRIGDAIPATREAGWPALTVTPASLAAPRPTLEPMSSERSRMSTPKQFDGSRRHMLDWVESPGFLDTVRQWVAPQGFSVASDAIWMPNGWDRPSESRLFDSASPYLDLGRKDTMRRWWLAHAGNIPNWDLIVQAAFRGAPALVLVEAKAHMGEFDCKPKPLSDGRDRDAQVRTNDNHLRIGRAIAEASNALSSVHRGISISCDRNYQLSNRIAMAWKLASLGIPNTLVFLGFTGDREISKEGNYFADDDHWHRAFADYLAGFLPVDLLETDISSGAAPFRVLSRSLPAIRDSRPIAERRVGRQASQL